MSSTSAIEYFPFPVRTTLPFSEAVRVGNMLYLSGQMGTDPTMKSLVPGGIEAETQQTLANMRAILERHGSSLDHVVRTRIFVTDAAHIDDVGRAHAEAFATVRPATTGLVVGLLDPRWLVEIEAEAVILRS